MRTPRRAVLLATVVLATGGASAEAYQHFSASTGGAGVSPNRWQSLPIPIVVDDGPTDIFEEIEAATTTWNDIATAQDVWGAPTRAEDADGLPEDFTGANFGTAWGKLTGDGAHEVIFDEDGSALTRLGLAPASVNGYGPSRERVAGGVAVIDDLYLIINGSRADFDRRATQVHELGHTLGLAHSSVGFTLGKPEALSPVTEANVPTMHPYSVAGGSQRRTPEADDVASLSELYPAGTFAASFGTLSGTVTRCGSDEPVLGANVRAINVSNPAIQLTRTTGHDGKTDGSYTMRGVPAGSYKILVEPLAGDADFLDRLATYTRIDTDFTQEYYNRTKEDDCGEDGDPSESEDLAVGAGGSETVNLKVDPVVLAFVVDVTGSMGPEIEAVKQSMRIYIDVVSALPIPFPNTAVVSFTDGVFVNVVSRDPAKLRAAVDALGAGGGDECPEAANAALVAAGRMLARNGQAILATDADSLPEGPSRETVENLLASKGARASTILSGACEEEPERRGGRAQRSGNGGRAGDELPPVDELGVESSIRTFSEITAFSGGFFSFQPEIKDFEPAPGVVERYTNSIANLAISSVVPAVAGLEPGLLPQGTTIDLELVGSNTSFGASTVAVGGAGVSVLSATVKSPTRMLVRLRAAPDAALGTRDVTVTTDLGGGTVESARGIGTLQVTAPPTGPTVLAVAPASAAQGSTLDVRISGGLTNFAAGVSTADFGAGITVDRLAVESTTAAVASLTVAPGATLGFRSVTVTTGAETATESVPGPFLVTAPKPAVPAITRAEPSAGAQGSVVDVTLTGANTAFADGVSIASVTGRGVDVLSSTVDSPTSMRARLQIAPDAALGVRDIIVATGGESAALPDGFRIVPAPSPPPPPVTTPVPGGPRPVVRLSCTDVAAPVARLAKGRAGVRVKRRRLRLRGTASDAGCAASALTTAVAGRVRRVEVAISRKAGRRCRWVKANGRLTKRRSCSKPVWLRAKGTTKWSLSVKRRLKRGKYSIRVRARDGAGNRQAKPARRSGRVR